MVRRLVDWKSRTRRTKSVFATVPAGSVNDARAALEAAKRAQPAWAALPPIVRSGYVSDLAAAVRREKAHLARIVVLEQGKPLNQAEGEIDAVVTFLTYAAENARRIEGDLLPSDHPNEDVWIRRVPFGVVVGLTAWNYPAALAARKIGPALVAGNTIVVKGHESTPLSAIEIARLAHEVGLPKGVLNVVTGDGRTVGDALVRSPLSDLDHHDGQRARGTGDLCRRRAGSEGRPFGTGRQSTLHRPRGRRYRCGRRGRDHLALHELRADLHLQRAHVSAQGHCGTLPRQVRLACEGS